MHGTPINHPDLRDYTSPFMLPLFGLLYLILKKKRSFYFLMFVILYPLGQFCPLLVNTSSGLVFFAGNSLYILAFIFLIIDTLERLRDRKGFKALAKKYKIHILTLVFVNIVLLKILLSYLDG